MVNICFHKSRLHDYDSPQEGELILLTFVFKGGLCRFVVVGEEGWPGKNSRNDLWENFVVLVLCIFITLNLFFSDLPAKYSCAELDYSRDVLTMNLTCSDSFSKHTAGSFNPVLGRNDAIYWYLSSGDYFFCEGWSWQISQKDCCSPLFSWPRSSVLFQSGFLGSLVYLDTCSLLTWCPVFFKSSTVGGLKLLTLFCHLLFRESFFPILIFF